jgi:hypothetical protein
MNFSKTSDLDESNLATNIQQNFLQGTHKIIQDTTKKICKIFIMPKVYCWIF